MRVPLSWLGEYVDLDATGLDHLALAERLTNAGLEVTGLEVVGLPEPPGAPLPWDRELVLLGQVLEVAQHPDADRLVLATVEYGADAPKQVVTGAPNLFPFVGQGDLAARRLFSPLLLEGGTYLDPYKDGKPTKLKGKKLRGIYNDAMLCSPVELGIGEDHDGILLIEDDPKAPRYRAGTPLADVLGDVVLEIDIIPNIARCASILGVAREVAALTGVELRLPSYELHAEGASVEGRVEIRSERPDLNPRFVTILVEGVSQHPAPFWMQHRLRLAGQRPINVVVDVSNYVMLEMGQPNHTFDYAYLRGRADEYAGSGSNGGPVQLITRLPHEGETLTTLDGVERKLLPNNILVTDPLGNLSLGGIMGGENSEIRPETTDVLVEAAAWYFINIRQSARQLALNTEASFRFSRGVHPSQALLGAKRAAELLRLYAGGTVAQGIVDYYPQPAPRVAVALDPAYVKRLTGLELERAQIAELLGRLEFEVTDVEGSGPLEVVAPDHRLDIEGPHDLVEEVCRMFGYENVPSTVLSSALPPQRGNRPLECEDTIKDALVGQGLQEVITYRLTTPQADARATLAESDAEAHYIRLIKPSTSERVVLRHHLLPSVLEIAAANSRFQEHIGLFEIGTVFPVAEGASLPEEHLRLAIVLTGPRRAAHWRDGAAGRYDFFDLKGVLETLGEATKVPLRFAAGEHPSLRPGRCAQLTLEDGTVVGYAGELHPTVAARYELRVERDQPVLAATLDLEALFPAMPKAFAVEPVPVYPAVLEDLALVVDASVPAATVAETLAQAGGVLLRDVELFDVYSGEKLGAGKRSLAYHLTYQAPDRTLTDRDVEKLRGKILKQAERQIGATLRE